MRNTGPIRVSILSGGIGGSKLVEGFARLDPPIDLTVIGNVGDDVEQHGLWVSPDIDILTYTLAGLVDREKGWGFHHETFHVLGALSRLGAEAWMNLGDRDLATHIYRTHLRKQGVRPTEIALEIARKLQVRHPIILPTDDPVQTVIVTDKGRLNFQAFYIREQCEPAIRDVRYQGAETATATPEALTAIRSAEWIVIAPSNPVGSIGPILAIPGIREAITTSPARKIAVSPIVDGKSLKGPSDRMLKAVGFTADPVGVAACYNSLIDAMIIDRRDQGFEEHLKKKGLQVHVTDTVMRTPEDRCKLAGFIAALPL